MRMDRMGLQRRLFCFFSHVLDLFWKVAVTPGHFVV